MKSGEALDFIASSDLFVLSGVDLGDVLRWVPGGHCLGSLGVLGGKTLAMSAIRKVNKVCHKRETCINSDASQ